jgi:hypothetical protein
MVGSGKDASKETERIEERMYYATMEMKENEKYFNFPNCRYRNGTKR